MKAASVLGGDVEIVAEDLRDPTSLAPALTGIARASFATAPSPKLHEEESHFIDAARAAGVHRTQ